MNLPRKFRFIGFQESPINTSAYPMFNNEDKYTVSLPFSLIVKDNISNYDFYLTEKQRYIKQGFTVIEREFTIDNARWSLFFKTVSI